MAAARVETAYVNGTGAPADPGNVARKEAFYEKLLQLHKDVVAGTHPRLSFAQQPLQNTQEPSAIFTSSSATAIAPVAAHTQTGLSSQLPPGLNSNAASHTVFPPASLAGTKPSTSATSTPAKAAGSSSKNEPTDDPVRLKRIREQRQQLERAIAEYAKADEPILKNAREIPLNLLALAHAQVAPVSGLKADSSDDSFDEDSYYSSKANSWSTEHTEPRQAPPDAPIVISDEENEDMYEPPSQVHGALAVAAQPKIPAFQRNDTVNSNGEWEPDWDEEDDYEPPAPAAFGGSSHARPGASTMAPPTSQRQTSGQMQAPEYVSRLHASSQGGHGHGQHMPTIAVNQIPTPIAPQPSRISPLTTGNITQTMQSQISSIQQAQDGNARVSDGQGNTQGVSAKELKRQRRLAKKEAKAAAAAESSKKRKRGATPPGHHDKKGKRRAVDASPDSYIKQEPASPLPGTVASVPSRRPSVVHRIQAEPAVQSSPYRPRSAYASDQDASPRQYRYADSGAGDRHAMPPPKAIRRSERDDQDLRRVASLQYARRPVSPGQEYSGYADPRPPRYEYDEPPVPRHATYREGSVRPSSVRPTRTPSPRGTDPYAPRYALPPPQPGQIVTDAYGNRYIAELVPEYTPSSRRPDDFYGQYPSSRRSEAYPGDPYRVAPSARAYSHVPEAASVDRRSRAYSHVPEPVPDPRATRAYSVHPSAAAPQHRELREADDAASYERRRASSRYQEPVSPRASAYSAEYAAPIARPYSTRPDAVRRDVPPEYASARAGSMAPTGGYARRGEMAPPALPVARARGAPPVAEEEYRYAPVEGGREQYGERRVASYRY